jgi:hypothetical protein
MNAIDIQAHTITLNDWCEMAEQHLLGLRSSWKKMEKYIEDIIPFSVIASIILIGCVWFYMTHSQTMTHHMAIGLFGLLVIGCLMATRSLFTETDSLRQLQAIGCLVGNTPLVLQFFNVLANAPAIGK